MAGRCYEVHEEVPVSWHHHLAIAETQMRAEYYRALIERAKLPASLARIHTEQATIEDMKVYLNFQEKK